MNIDLLGYLAAFLTSASFIPQAWLVIKTRNTQGLSLMMYSAFTLGVALWCIYGVISRAWPVAIANLFTTIFALVILGVLIDNRRKAKAP